MILPGKQAVLGFQPIAALYNGFNILGPAEQKLHLCALLLVVSAVALIMTPAAYHRIAERGIVSRRFVQVASRLLATAVLPLALGLSLDVFLVARLILHDTETSVALATVLLVLFFGLWYVFPWISRRLGKGVK